MKISYDCLPCVLNSFIKALNKHINDEREKELLIREYLEFISKISYDFSPPELGREIHKMIKTALRIDDPYAEEKNYYQKLLLERIDEFRNIIDNSNDVFIMSAKLAAIGNAIDFGANHDFDFNDVYNKINNFELSISNCEELLEDIKTKNTLLYLGDNCGENVLDKLFIEQIKKVNESIKIHYVVRSKPIINDVTSKDAYFVGLDQYCSIIENGDDSPATILDRCSKEFNDIFYKSDIVISKGQGNYESLSDNKREIYFILMIKCKTVSKNINAANRTAVVYKHN